ncbi:hypothetical protein QBC39DRAFT_352378 [Podospora conica]|nr:hypothetical protein QBC39DRAFT_352378 [Schizothecium conicum]
MSYAPGENRTSRTARRAHRSIPSTPSAESNDVGATVTRARARNQTSISDMQRWNKDSKCFLWQTPEAPQPTQKKATRSLLWDNTVEKDVDTERKPRKLRRKAVRRRPACSRSIRQARSHGHISTPEMGPLREDASNLPMSSSQQSLARDPSPGPRSDTAGRDDEAPDFDAIRASLAPFDINNELGEWEFSKEEGRWWRLNKTANSIILAPTADMFS